MKLPGYGFTYLLIGLFFTDCSQMPPSGKSSNTQEMLIRIAEIEVDSIRVDEYLTVLREEAAASVRLEPGVLSIFPMYEKAHPTSIRILEIYASKEAYETHLKTPHFLHYKSATSDMVKGLRRVDMEALDPGTMELLFRKIKS